MHEILLFIVAIMATWQAVEIFHHSTAGTPWRNIAEYLKDDKGIPTLGLGKIIGEGMSCPFCYSNWVAFLFVGCYALYTYTPLMAFGITFCVGLAVARGANVMNDWMHDPGRFICRTPNKNPNSKSGQIYEIFEDDELEVTDLTDEVLKGLNYSEENKNDSE